MKNGISLLIAMVILAGCGEKDEPVRYDVLMSTMSGTGNWEVFAVDINGIIAQQVSASPGYDLDAHWSPDGEHIALASTRGACNVEEEGGLGYCDFELFVVNADGSVVQQLTKNGWTDDQPAWSPDGERIAFRSDRTFDVELFIFDKNGKHLEQLTDSPGEDWTPTWSPDGSMLAFASNRDGNWDIFTVRSDGSEERQVTDDPEDQWLPDWSPDGSMLAFSSNRDGNWDIFTMRVDGTEMRQITNNPAIDTEPVWSPDGSALAFARKIDGQTYELFLTDLAGKITETPFWGYPTDWRAPPKGLADS